MSTKKAGPRNTSPTVASKASKILRDPKSSPTEKSVAAAALNDARDKPKPPAKKP